MNLKEHEEIIRSAQYRKGLSIAFFNATNASIELCKGLNIYTEETKAKIVELRNWFLEEHKKYYTEVIMNIGKHYDLKTTIEKLNKATTIEELKNVWVGLSEDERQDDEVIKEKNKLKEKYEKI